MFYVDIVVELVFSLCILSSLFFVLLIIIYSFVYYYFFISIQTNLIKQLRLRVTSASVYVGSKGFIYITSDDSVESQPTCEDFILSSENGILTSLTEVSPGVMEYTPASSGVHYLSYYSHDRVRIVYHTIIVFLPSPCFPMLKR